MAAFRALRDVSNNFESELRRVSSQLFTAKIGENFEDKISKKMQDLFLFSSKLRLLQAKPLAVSPQITETEKNEFSILSDYSDTAMWKLIELQTVKSVTQSYAVKQLVTTPDQDLVPELLEKKEKIVEQLTNYAHQEAQLRHFEEVLKEKEFKLMEARKRWDEAMCRLKDSKTTPTNEEQPIGPLYKKLKVLVDKMELMRWLVARLVTSRTGDYDWATDPHKRLRALAMARQRHAIEDYTEIF